jgi:hypothetical protein
MHEIRVTVPEGRAKDVVELAHKAGIPEVSVYPVFAHGPNCTKEVISAQTSTPRAKKFADAVLTSDWFSIADSSISSRQLRAIVDSSSPFEVTRPMLEPPIDVFQDLWQLNHVTISYWARAAGGAVLLAYGMFKNDPVMIVVAALFLPFMSQVLGLSFGTWAGDFKLGLQALKALTVSCVVSVIAGIVVALLNHAAPMNYHGFLDPLPSFAISAVIGFCAGLITEDDAGRRYLIGVAAAVQYGVYPVWIGYSCIAGFPDASQTAVRIGTFGINVCTITALALTGYLSLDIKRKDVRGFLHKRANDKEGSGEV